MALRTCAPGALAAMKLAGSGGGAAGALLLLQGWCSTSSSGAGGAGARSASVSTRMHSWCAPGTLQQPPLPPQHRPGRADSAPGATGGSSGDGSSGGGGPDVPLACGHPKDKISRHRAGNRRRIYYRKPQGLLASCK